MTPILWVALVVALVVGAVVGLLRRRVAPVLVALGVVGIVTGGLGWGAWMGSRDVSASVQSAGGSGLGRSCHVRWMDRVERTSREADVDCVGDVEPGTDVRVKAHVWPLTGRATAHGGPVRDLVLGWVPGIGTVLALAGARLAGRRQRAEEPREPDGAVAT